MQALRDYYAGVATAINAWDFTVPELTEHAAPALVSALPERVAVEKGRQWPGPVPFTPVEIVVDTPERKDVLFCAQDDGFSRVPGESTPAAPRTVLPGLASLSPGGDGWIVDEIYQQASETLDCSTIEVREVPF